MQNEIRQDQIVGSRRFSNYFWAISLLFGGIGFLLAGLSSYFKINFLIFQKIGNWSPSPPLQVMFLNMLFPDHIKIKLVTHSMTKDVTRYNDALENIDKNGIDVISNKNINIISKKLI